MDEYPQDLLEDHYRLSALVVELINRFKDGIIIHIIDPQSLQGIIKSLRYRVRKYPTFVVDNQEKIIGWNLTALDQVLRSRFADQSG